VLKDENTPAVSDAAYFIAEKANEYNEENPLYIVAIGAITNVASAFIVNPDMKDKVVVVWLGGHAFHWKDTKEFNMYQDVAAARVVFTSKSPLVILPCFGVVSAVTTTKPELEYWLGGKNSLCDYLIKNTVEEAESYAKGRVWSRVIWDITAVLWFFNENGKLMSHKIVPTPLPEYDNTYNFNYNGKPMVYVDYVNRDESFNKLFDVLINK
jgi:inosine-uridine nucleoside N-ribohydrolase